MRNKAEVIDLTRPRNARKRSRAKGEPILATFEAGPMATHRPLPLAPVFALLMAAWCVGFLSGAAWTWWWR